MKVLLSVDVDDFAYAENKGIPVTEVSENIAGEFESTGDARTWWVTGDQHTISITDV